MSPPLVSSTCSGKRMRWTRQARRVQAVVIAIGVNADGRREVLSCAVGDSETQAFWRDFLRHRLC